MSKGALQHANDIGLAVNHLALSTEGLGEGHEVRILQRRSKGNYLLCHDVLQHAVVDDNDDDGQPVLNCRREFHADHGEAAVTTDSDGLLGRISQLYGNGSGQAEAHGSEPTAHHISLPMPEPQE